ncbi:MAG: cell division protein FtsQ [Bacteroidota bacterium]
MKKKHLILRIQQLSWAAVLLIMVMLVSSAVNKRQETRSAREMEINIETETAADSSLITKLEIEELLQTSFNYSILDSELKRIDVQRAERVLEKNPFVKNADVFIDNRGKININVEQRKPVLRVMDSEGRSYYLDASGNYMPLSTHYTARVLVLTGYIRPHEPNFINDPRNMLKNLFDLTTILRKDEFFNHMIEQVHVAQNGDILFIPKLGKQQILFGKYLNIDAKLQRLKIFYNEAMPQAGWTKYKQIDIRFKNQIVCKK